MPLAGILIGLLIGVEANWVSLRSWLFLSAVLDLIGVIPVWNSRKLIVPNILQFPRSFDAVASIAERFAHRARVYASSTKFQFWIGCLIATKIAVLTMVSFEWKLSVQAVYVDDEESLTRFFGVLCCDGCNHGFVAGFRRRLAFEATEHRDLNVGNANRVACVQHAVCVGEWNLVFGGRVDTRQGDGGLATKCS